LFASRSPRERAFGNQLDNVAMRQTLREALGIRHWALPACAETRGETAGAPQRTAALPTLPHYRISELPH